MVKQADDDVHMINSVVGSAVFDSGSGFTPASWPGNGFRRAAKRVSSGAGVQFRGAHSQQQRINPARKGRATGRERGHVS